MTAEGIVGALVYKVDGTAQSRPLSVVFDQDAHTLTMVLPFADRAAYDEVVGALVTSGSEAHLQVQCSHLYNVTVTERHFNWPHVFVGRPVMMAPAVLGRAVQPTAAAAPAHITPLAAAGLRDHRVDVQMADRIPFDVGALHHRGVDETLGGLTTTTTSEQTQTFVHSFALPLHFPAANPDVFPDLPAQHQSGWGQVQGTSGPVFYKENGVAAFVFLPTNYKLGYYADQSGGVRPPMRSEIFVNPAGAYRIRVTLIAVPFISDADRATLRTHLLTTVLGGTARYAGMDPASGLQSHFVADFTTTTGTTVLTASIQFQAQDAVPDQRLVLVFEMDALDYSIFCEMLRHGLHGKVQVDAQGIQPQIDVGLRFDDIVTNAVTPDYPKIADPSAPSLVVANALDLPVTIPSMTVSLIDKGSVPGLIRNLQEVTLLRAQTVAAKGSATAAITPSIPTWDAVVVSGSPGSVDGGSADDWFARVHRDPSLQPRDFSITPQILLPTGGERVQLVRMKLFKDTEPTPRVERQVAPAAPQALTFPLSLTELMGTGAERPRFVIEYQSMYSDNTTSLAQRISVEPDQHTVSLQALVEAPSSTYTVEYDDHGPQHVDGDRAAASQLIDRLRTEGKTWSVYVHAAAPQPVDPPPDTTHTTPVTTDPPPVTSTATVTIITDLLAPAFASQGLKRAFVVLQATTTGAPSSTIVIEPATPAPVIWQPTGGTIPPFNYRITYLYHGAVSKKVEGTESNLLLVLDPPTP